jgi:hypothetical protein
MKRLLIALLMLAGLFVVTTAEQWFLMTPAARAQTNTFCASNLACTVTGVWTFNAVGNFNSIFYVDGTKYTTIEAALAANGCSSTIVVKGGFTETAAGDLFAGFHTGACLGALYLQASSVVTVNFPVLVPNGYTIKGDYGAHITAGGSFPTATVASANAQRSAGGVVTFTTSVGLGVALGTPLQMSRFTAINGTCIVTAIAGTAVTCQGNGGSVVNDTCNGTCTVTPPVVVLGDTPNYGGAFDHGSRLQDVVVECANIPGSTGIYSNSINELSGAGRIAPNNCVYRGIKIEQTAANSVQSAGGSPQNWDLQDLDITMSANSTIAQDSVGFEIAGTSSTIFADTSAERITVTANGAATQKMQSCMRLINTAAASFVRVHFEQCVDGIELNGQPNAGTSTPGAATLTPGVDLLGVSGNSTVTNVVHIRNVASGRNISIHGATLNGATNLVLDDINTNTVTAQDSILYRVNSDGSVCSSIAAIGCKSSGFFMAPSFRSTAANIASVGQIRLGNTDSACWRNAANNADICMQVNGSNQFQFANHLVPSTTGFQLGVGSLPWNALVLGTAATNNFTFTPGTTAAARAVSIPDPLTNVNLAFNLSATSSAFATATTAGTCVQSTTAVAGATTTMVAEASPVSTPGVGAVWSAFVSSAGNVTINECAVAASAGGTIAFNIRVHP